MSEKAKKTVFWGILATEVSHVFCCVLPMLFSMASLLTAFGLVVVMPAWIETLHDLIHDWEPHIILASAVLLSLGWGLHYYSYKQDCHAHGCTHEPCTPRKNAASLVLKIASILFLINIVVFTQFHDGTARMQALLTGAEIHHHDHDHSHDHHGHDH